jgi:hypothetical protein
MTAFWVVNYWKQPSGTISRRRYLPLGSHVSTKAFSSQYKSLRVVYEREVLLFPSPEICTRIPLKKYEDSSETSEKTTFWRAYSCSLLFQNPDYQETIRALDGQIEDISLIVSHLLTDTRISLTKGSMKWLEDIVVIAAELKCQRAVHEVDESVVLGSKYDDVAMDDVTDSIVDDDPRTFVVTGIISRGLVRRRCSGSEEVMAYICKTRVLVECVERPSLKPDGEYMARTPGADRFDDRTTGM